MSVLRFLPNVHLRKDVWQSFPVHLIPLGRNPNGDERHAIVWNRKRLSEWRATHPPSEWMDYEVNQTAQLMAALSQSTMWAIEQSSQYEHICVVRMCSSKTTRPTDVYIRSPIPVLTRLNDIKAFFPVVWHEDPNNAKTYSIELHKTKLKALSPSRKQEMVDSLCRALYASTAWKVLPPMSKNEMCRIQF